MTTALHLKTRVKAGGRIEIVAPELQEGQEADIMITVKAEPSSTMHVLDIVASIPPHRHFQRAEDVDDYLRVERDAWE
jgi:hypothetical protein